MREVWLGDWWQTGKCDCVDLWEERQRSGGKIKVSTPLSSCAIGGGVYYLCADMHTWKVAVSKATIRVLFNDIRVVHTTYGHWPSNIHHDIRLILHAIQAQSTGNTITAW